MSRAALLKRKPKRIELDGDAVFVRSLTLRESLKVDELTKSDPGGMLRYVVACAVTDDNGKPLFENENDQDISEIPVDTIGRLADEIQKLTKFGKLETAEKN